MIEVYLGPRDLAAIKERASARQIENSRARRQTLKIADRQSDYRIHVVGAFCEVATEIATGNPCNCTVHRGSDFRRATAIADVGDYEIKGTDLPNGRLLIPEHLKHKHSLDRKYLLVRADLMARRAVLVGWAWGFEFIGRPECLDRRLPAPAYSPRRLHDIA